MNQTAQRELQSHGYAANAQLPSTAPDNDGDTYMMVTPARVDLSSVGIGATNTRVVRSIVTAATCMTTVHNPRTLVVEIRTDMRLLRLRVRIYGFHWRAL